MRRRGVAVALVVVGAAALVALALRAPRAEPARPAGRGEQSIGLFDPHLHVALLEARPLDPAEAPAEAAPTGRAWVVTLRARSDAARIEIDLSTLGIELLDGAGRRHVPRRLAGADGAWRFEDRLRLTLRPGDSITQSFLFELPPDATDLVLSLGCSDGPGRFLPRGIVRLLGECAAFVIG